MTTFSKQEPLYLQEAAKLFPRSADGKAVHLSTLMRWIKRGLRGVRLEAVRIGGRWAVSREAIQRFTERLTKSSLPCDAPSPVSQSAFLEAECELERLGI